MKRPRLLARAGFLLACSLLAAFSCVADDTVPEPAPEPQLPDTAGLSDEDRRRAIETWKAEHTAWETGLTAGQVLLLERRKYDRYATSSSSFRAEDQLPGTGADYSWRKTAEQWNLNPEMLASLEKHQLAFGFSVRQSFSPYLSGPVFITSDSALNAFHVLFEDSFRELELRRCETLRSTLETILSEARTPTERPRKRNDGPLMSVERHARAIAHLEHVLGPALVILGTPIEFFAETDRADVARDAALIASASSTSLPSWLAPTDSESLEAIDFRRCTPVGFYAASPRLNAYFRAVRWLQSVPMRAARSHEFDAAVLFGVAAVDRGLRDTLRLPEVFIGRGDDPTSLDLMDVLDNTWPRRAANFDPNLPTVRNRVAREFVRDGYYRINSELRSGRTMEETFAAVSFRLLPAAAFPDSILFQELMDRGARPSGLAVAKMLGSSFARIRLDESTRKACDSGELTLTALAPAPRRRDDPSLYATYLNTLQALFIPAEPGTPPYMRTELWEAKSCQASLAGWAQMRHTFTLQAKMARNYMGLVLTPPGFVEENPEFFARLARLVDQSINAFSGARCFEPSGLEEADRILQTIARIAQIPTRRLDGSSGLSFEDQEIVWTAEGLAAVGPGSDGFNLPDPDEPDFNTRKEEIIRTLKARADGLEAGTIQPAARDSTLRERWTMLGRTIHTLEALAQKGLRAAPWSPEEEEFLKNYGESMAFVLGYFGNSWLTPRDDAPRWAEVCGFPDRGTSLIAAIGRPREIFVLHPWNGHEVLCRGSVMQYYEYESPEQMTDEQWRDRLDSEKAPPLPSWIADFAQPPAFNPKSDH